MNDMVQPDEFGTLTEPATLTITRVLPGPLERVWNYLTQSDLRRQWLAAGEMGMNAGTSFELVWRNDELTNPPGKRPEGLGEENRLRCEIIELDPPRRLSFTWGNSSSVLFELEPRGEKVLLTLTHARIPNRSTMLDVSSGWHAHLDILAARLSGSEAAPFWDSWKSLRREYDRRLPA